MYSCTGVVAIVTNPTKAGEDVRKTRGKNPIKVDADEKGKKRVGAKILFLVCLCRDNYLATVL